MPGWAISRFQGITDTPGDPVRTITEPQADPSDSGANSAARRAAAEFGACAARRVGPLRWQLLSLVYGSRLSQDEIAVKLGLPTMTVRSEIARSLQVVAAVVCEQP